MATDTELLYQWISPPRVTLFGRRVSSTTDVALPRDASPLPPRIASPGGALSVICICLGSLAQSLTYRGPMGAKLKDDKNLTRLFAIFLAGAPLDFRI